MTEPPEPPDDRVSGLVSRLLGCLCAQLADTVAGPPVMCCVRPGLAAPADLCCQAEVDGETREGQAWVRVARIYPTTGRFPQQAVDRQICATGGWAAELEMGAWRCAATVDDDGSPPACGDVTRDALVALSDAAAMRRAARCCFPDEKGDPPAVVGEWVPLGPNGGCTGGTLTLTAQFYDCACP